MELSTMEALRAARGCELASADFHELPAPVPQVQVRRELACASPGVAPTIISHRIPPGLKSLLSASSLILYITRLQ
jgi:hypothetical protein